MAYASEKVRELRYLSSGTMSTTFANAAGTGWNTANATKVRFTAYDDKSLTYLSANDDTIQDNVNQFPAQIPTLRGGTFSFTTYLGGGNSSDNTACTTAALLYNCLGDIQNPSNASRTDAADNTGVHTTTRIYAAGIVNEIVTGQGVLIGTRGDGRGNGEVRYATAVGTNYIDLNMATSSAVADGDQLVIGTTVFLSEDVTQARFMDFLTFTQAVYEQRQMIGCCGGFSLEQLEPGELPKVNFSLNVADWQWYTTTDLSGTLSSTPAGNDPPNDTGLGGFFLQDNGTTTRAVLKGGKLSVPSFLEFEKLPDCNGVNGIGGWVRKPSAPKATFSLLFDEDMPGLYNDFLAGTAKQLIMQWGTTVGGCVAVDFPKCYLDQAPVASDLAGLRAIECSIHGTLANTSGATGISRTPFKIHFF